jgi:RNA polymerase-binding transcription factor DksA
MSGKKAVKKKAVKKKAASQPKTAKARSGMSANIAAILGVSTSKGSKASAAKSGNANGMPKVKAEWVKYYKILMELRERLKNQMAGLAKESAEEIAGYSLHMADSGTDNFDRDFALSLLSSDQDAVYEIEEAMQRIEKKTYGVWELTGKPIPKARLDAIPWTRFTVDAQMQLEKEGALKSRRLGNLGSVDSSGSFELADDDSEEKAPKAKN